ncbi:hypothetical protein BC830DRAFT_195932 [Chytriomyces sp. MP71]|nr:hypothetical protein BC830DRAFT_195932 [Chytriomyces sp. MP71]
MWTLAWAATLVVFSDPSLCPIDVNRYPVEFSVSQDQFTMWMEVRKAAMNIGGSCKAAIGQIWPGIDQTNCIKDVGVSSMTKEAFSFKQWPPSMHISKQSKVKGQMGSSAKYGNDPQKMPSIARIANIAPFPPQQKLDQQQIPVPPIMQAQIADSASRLSTAGIAGIVLGSVVGLSVLAFLIFYAVRQSRSASDPIYQSIPKRAPLSTLASYNNRGGAPSDYYPITEDMDLKKRGSSASLPRPGSRQSVTLEYTAAQPDELSVRVGDVLVLREYREKGWGLGVLERTRSTGLFPLVCVGIVEPDD